MVDNLFIKFALIAIIAHQSSGQSRFIAYVGLFQPPWVPGMSVVPRCAATVITERHVVTAATCVSNLGPMRAVVQFRTQIGQSLSISNLVASDVIVHPNHPTDHHRFSNIAVIRSSVLFNSTEFPARSLGGIQLNTQCRLFGWGGSQIIPRRENIVIHESSTCDSNFPQAVCSFVDANTAASCDALLGSPVMCATDLVIDGIAINDGFCESANGREILNYHSIAPFRDWILSVTSAEMTGKMSLVLIAGSILLSVRNLTIKTLNFLK